MVRKTILSQLEETLQANLDMVERLKTLNDDDQEDSAYLMLYGLYTLTKDILNIEDERRAIS